MCWGADEREGLAPRALNRPLTIGVDARELQGRPTGTGRYLRSLLRVWTASSEDRLVAYFNGPAPPDPVLDHPRLTRRPLGERAVRGLLWQELRLPSAARADALDVFFAPAYSCPLRLPVPRVTTVHDLSFFAIPDDFSLLEGCRRRASVSASLGVSAAILAVSEFTRREIHAWFPGTRGRVACVPHGLDDDLAAPPPRAEARRRLGVRGPLVLTVGSIFNRRRLPVLLTAVARLRRAHPSLVLDVAGENRTQPPLDLRALVRGLGLEDSVRLSGFVDEPGLADRYSAADAVVYLSEYEGFGLPVLEALVRGVPVVTSTRPATGELFGEAALLTDPADPGAVAGALDGLLRDPALRADLVARGRALASRFSWRETARRTRDVLASVARR